MRVTGSGSEADERAQSEGAMAQQPGAHAPPVGFEPFTYHGFSGMNQMPPAYNWSRSHPPASKKKVYFSEPEASGYSSAEEAIPTKKYRGTKLPPFAQKWFAICKDRKEEIRQIKQQWVAAQTASGNPEPLKDVDGMKQVMPKCAAQWFALPDDEKEKYRNIKKEKKLEKKGGVDIPPFAAKWFALSDKKKNEYRIIKRQLKSSKKAWLSDGDEEVHQSEPDIDYEGEGVPRFAARWFSLPKSKKDEIRVKYRHHKKCKKHDCDGADAMIGMMNMQGADAMSPMMYPYGPQAGYPMPWMAPYYQQDYPMCAPTPQSYMHSQCTMVPPYCAMKRFYKAQMKTMRRKHGWGTSDTSGDESSKQPITSSDSDSSDDEVTEMPTFVKKWFSLPMEARQQLRMLKHQQKDGKSNMEGIPPFAKKWFELPEKTKQQMRKLKREQNREQKRQAKGKGKQQITEENADDVLNESPRDHKTIDVTLLKSNTATKEDIPEFARLWFSLPVEKKYHLRMLNRHLSSISGTETSEDEYEETMPDFAAQWFALSSEERQHLRDLKHEAKPKKSKVHSHKKGLRRFGGFGWNPWQQWGFQPMGYFGGNKRGSYHPVHEHCRNDERHCSD